MQMTSVEDFKRISELEHVMGLTQNPEKCFQKLIFWSHELKQNYLADADISIKINALNNFLFVQKKIQRAESAFLKTSIETTLQNKKGNSCSIGLIYKTLAEICGIEFHFIQLKPFSILKHIDDGKTIYINIDLLGQITTLQEIISMIQPRNPSEINLSNQLFEKMESQQIQKLYGMYLSRGTFYNTQFKNPLNQHKEDRPETDL